MERILIIALGIALTSGSGSQASPLPAPIRIPLSATVISLNPAGVQDDSSLWISRQVNCQLVRLHAGQIEFEAAEQIKFIDPTTIELTLRDGAKFYDGSPVQADDVIATLGYLKKSRNIFRNIFTWIKEIRKQDARHVIILLKHPVPHFLKVLSAPNYALFKRDFIDKAEKNPELWKQPMGCGKYKITTWTSQLIRMEPRETGLPIEFSLMANNQLAASDTAKFDMVSIPVAGGTIPENKFRAESYLDPGQFYIGLNTRLPRWRTKENRCRFFSRLDPKEIVVGFQKDGDAEGATDIFPRGVIGYSPAVDYPKELSTWKKKEGPSLGKNFCLMFHSSSVAEKYRPAFTAMVGSHFAKPSTQILSTSVRFGERFQDSGCDGLAIGFKSNYLDGYEYLLLFSEKDANFTGYWNRDLINEIKSSQNFDNNKTKFDGYQAIAEKIRNECLLFPVLTLPMRKVYVRQELKTPGIGMTAVNDYFLGQVER